MIGWESALGKDPCNVGRFWRRTIGVYGWLPCNVERTTCILPLHRVQSKEKVGRGFDQICFSPRSALGGVRRVDMVAWLALAQPP